MVALPAVIIGQIDRIDRLPSGGIEVIDCKTGRVSSRVGEFAATPGDPCRYCDFATMCPERVG